jgi:cysteine-rich repeat protein
VVNDCLVNCGDTCNPHPGPGSNDASATSCVCGVVPSCCTTGWTATCVAAATNDCGACDPAVCGDGAVTFPEQCDDGNNTNNDGCSATCLIENAVCGDSDVEGNEECDDGDTTAGDGCNATCQFEGFACVDHDTPGVADEAVETCVCALDSFCCENSWDSICVNEAQDDCNVVCGDPCAVHANPGSNDPATTECVCVGDPFCCTMSWDSMCVAEAQTDCGACNNNVCGNGIKETGEECDDGGTVSLDGCNAVCQYEGSVCVPRATEGADNDTVVACVCALDTFCCSTSGAWDDQCVTAANTSCSAGCGSPCTAHAGVGSSNGAVTECVCGADPYCCNTAWDSICVGEADNDCNAGCP